jgi:hypothetical protein
VPPAPPLDDGAPPCPGGDEAGSGAHAATAMGKIAHRGRFETRNEPVIIERVSNRIIPRFPSSR